MADSLEIDKIPSNTLNTVHCHKVEELAKPFRANTGPIAQLLPFLAACKRRSGLTASAIDDSMAGIGAIEAVSSDVVEVVTERGYINAIASSSNLPNGWAGRHYTFWSGNGGIFQTIPRDALIAGS